MVVIKRYLNRKLYDTVGKQYITLAGVAELIRQGCEIQVVDNASGEDLTAYTLAQIIMEQEKNQAGRLPHSFLADMIRWRGLYSFAKNQIPTHDDLQRLYNQLDELSHKLAEISEKDQ